MSFLNRLFGRKRKPDPEELSQTILAFVHASSWEDSRRIVKTHPELLTDQADALLGQLAAIQEGNRARQMIQDRRTLLRSCRDVGIEATFVEKTGGQDVGVFIPDEFRTDLNQVQEAEQHYLRTGDRVALNQAAAAWEYILDHPLFATTPERFQLAALNNAGRVFQYRYWAAARLKDLNQALDCWQQAVVRTPLDSPDLPMCLNNLGSGLNDRYARTGQVEDLEEAISLYQQAVTLTPLDSPNLPMYLNNLGAGLCDRYAQTGRMKDLEEAISLYQQAVTLTPPDYPDLAGCLNNLGNGLNDRYARTGRMEDLEEAISRYQQAVAHTPPDSPDLPMYLNNLGAGLCDRYTRTGQMEDLEEAISLYQQVVALTLPDSPDLPGYLNNLGNGLRDRHARTDRLEDLEQAISVLQQAIALTPPNSPDLPRRFANLGARLRDRYARTGGMEDLEEAISFYQQAIALTPPNSPDLPRRFTNLGNRLRDRYARTGRMKDLEEAISLYQQAIALTPLDSPDLPGCLNNLGNGLNDRYARTGRMEDLEEAISRYQQAVAHTPPDSPDLPRYLSNLSAGLRTRYARTGQVEDLEETISVYRQAVAHTPLDSSDLPSILSNLGNGLNDRYARTGRTEDLEEAISVFQQAVTLTLPDSPELPRNLNNLGNGLRTRYTRTGQVEDLEEAISLYRQAVTLTPPDSPNLPMYLNNLGAGLRDRHARTGRMEDLEEAIPVLQQAAVHTPPDSPNLPMYLNNLGAGLRDRHARTGRMEDLEEAIPVLQQAVAHTPPDSPALPMCLNNLGAGLRDRYARTERIEDLEEAISVLQQAIALTPSDSPALPMCLNNLGVGLSDRHARTGRIEDLEEAIFVFQQAVTLTLSDSPELPRNLNNLGNGLRTRCTRTGWMEDLEQAIRVYEQACQRGKDVASEGVLHVARNWGGWAIERQAWEEAVRAYSFGLEASEHLLQEQILRVSTETWLHEMRTLHTRAAYAWIQTGDLSGAVQVLERGRARLLAEALEHNRRDLQQLEPLVPSVYQQYFAVLNRLHALQTQEDTPTQTTQFSSKSRAEAIRQARTGLNEAVQAIRRVPGYGDLLKPWSLEQIQSVADSVSPLTYFAVSPAGTVALVVTPTAIHPVHCDLTEDALREHILGPADDPQLGAYLGAYSTWRRSPHDPVTHTAWLAALDHTTHWLWDALMAPVVQTLTDFGATHAVFIPQGLLGLLPLHTAWTEANGKRTYALDHLTLTYAPNARALSTARATAARVSPDRIFAIDEPQPVSASPLPNSNAEVSAACEHFSHRQVLGGDSATEQAVRDQLPHHTVLHFSCHGFANFAHPLESGLLMAHDETLTLRDILALRLENARLAILSACETGIPGTDLPDEVISLPTGLAQAGIAGVIASLWSVSDLSTMMLMARFYQLWKQDGLEPPAALRQAQLWLRDTTNAQKAEYFQTFLPTSDTARLPVHIADTLYKHTLLARPDDNDFAHPFYWAAFTYTGV